MEVKKIIKNKYFALFLIFTIWMLFFDENSYIFHRKLNKEIHKIEKWNSFYKRKTIEDNKEIEKLQDSIQIEKYVREKYLMKKKNEDIYIVEFDTIN